VDSKVKLYLERGESKLLLSKVNFDISTNQKFKEMLGVPKEKTFYNDVISEAYFAIFYAAKAFLCSRNLETSGPEEHKKTYEEFKRLVDSGIIDAKLWKIYQEEATKAETLLKIFFEEKRKRGIFTYNVQSEANIPFAKESIENAKTFISLIKAMLK